MDVTAITQIISTLGFPIAACVALFWYLNKERESHKEEMDALKVSLDANTQILSKLQTYLEVINRNVSGN